MTQKTVKNEGGERTSVEPFLNGKMGKNDGAELIDFEPNLGWKIEKYVPKKKCFRGKSNFGSKTTNLSRKMLDFR